jgi:hypothetical protein
MKKLTPYILFALILLALIWKSCEDARAKERLINQLSEYQLKEKAFEVKRRDDSSTLAIQGQTIMSQKDAIALGLLELEKEMKQIQSQVKQKSTTTILEKQIPYIPDGYADTSGLVRNENGDVIRKDSIAVPTRFQLEEKWFKVDGYVKKDGLKIDSLKIPNKTVVSIGYQKAGFLNLSKDPVVMVKNENPYVSVDGLDNVIIKNKRPFWKNPLFTIGIGVALGQLIIK